MKSCSTAYHTKRHKKHLGKLTTVYAELTNLDLAWGPTSKAWLLLAKVDF